MTLSNLQQLHQNTGESKEHVMKLTSDMKAHNTFTFTVKEEFESNHFSGPRITGLLLPAAR